jgi:hypothetical protein
LELTLKLELTFSQLWAHLNAPPPSAIPLEGLSARGFGRRGVSDGAIVQRRSGGFYHGVSLVILIVILRMKEKKME